MTTRIPGNTSSTDDEFCFDKKKMRKRKECRPRKKYPEPVTKPKFDENVFASHKHPNLNSNAIGNSFNKQKHLKKYEHLIATLSTKNQKNAILFADSMLKSLCRKEFNKNLNGGITHLKPFPESEAMEMDHHPSNFRGTSI